ncbi:phosphopantetheine-binding protein [Massilia sp. H-1]|nr:phosphopantetheine-binding protein [Massilia sp. H-1]
MRACNAHFFELGGHSSLAVRMVYRVQQSLQVSVVMRELFHQPVLHQFAAIVAERRDAALAAREAALILLRPDRPSFLRRRAAFHVPILTFPRSCPAAARRPAGGVFFPN